MISESRECGKLDGLLTVVDDLKEALLGAQRCGEPLHVVERDVVRPFVMRMGRIALEGFVQMQGTGDRGPILVSSDGRELDRLEETRPRSYVSVFGPLEIERTVYTRGSKQQTTAPLDSLLGLPEGKFSFLVQEFAQMLGIDLAWDKTREVLERVVGIHVPVDSLERLNRHMAQAVPQYRDQRATPLVQEEGEIFVGSADGKGIVMRQPSAETATPTSSLIPPETKGPRPGRKSMSVVGTLYSVDRYVRTPEQMLEMLFRDGPPPDDEPRRPKPCGKHVWAALDDEVVDTDGSIHAVPGLHITFEWLSDEWNKRDPEHHKPLVRLMDGEHRLWEAADEHLPRGGHPDDADVLDIVHVAEYLWDAASVLKMHREHQEAFFRDQMGRVLRGEVDKLIPALRGQATRSKLHGPKLKAVQDACTYFENNRDRMHYDQYLAHGYPIASGAVEGACRHLVKDRLERTGMRWVPEGAQAMLNLRSLWINDEWDDYQKFYADGELNHLYPDRKAPLNSNQQCLP